MASKTAVVILAEGAEEIESVVSIDVLRRAKVEVIVAGLDGNIVECSRGVNIKPDKCLADLKDNLYDAVVLPGGLEGAKKLAESSDVGQLLKRHYRAGNIIAAICAAPTVLAAHDIGKGKRVTSYPSVQAKMHEYNYSEKRVVRDGNLITSRGPGTAFEFALEIVSALQVLAYVTYPKSEAMLKDPPATMIIYSSLDHWKVKTANYSNEWKPSLCQYDCGGSF